MNDFDVERLLPSLFYLIITRGRQRGKKGNDPTAFDKYVEELAHHPRVQGFGTPEGRRLLGQWVRTSLVRLGKIGRGKRGEQIEFVVPFTLLTYKMGFPAEIRRQRNVHVFLYQIFERLLSNLDAKPDPSGALAALFAHVFGRGVAIGAAPEYNGEYDGKTDVDLHELLCLCYLDGFHPVEASKKEAPLAYGPSLPWVAREMARHLLLYIIAYQDRMPKIALTRGLMALINFKLFIYTLKLIYAVNSLVKENNLPPAMRDQGSVSPPELYVDFARVRNALSDEMARACVERDLEELRAFFESAMLLRTIDRFAEGQSELKERLTGRGMPACLHSLLGLRGDPNIKADARAEIRSIREETLNSCLESDKVDVQAEIEELKRQSPGSDLDHVVRLLVEAQRSKAVDNYVAWFGSVGGLRKSFGLLAGNPRGRRNWRYAMSDDLLGTLVQLALIEDPTGRLEHPRIRTQLRLRDFLAFLEHRFGIVVDRPPGFLSSAIARAAASENLEALRRRLRQMGFFQALSDDFTAQYLRSQQSTEVAL
jgi:hypothetical protein